METAVFLIPAAYLIGSIPFGYLLVRVVKGVDVRSCGSHNIGAVNVSRVGGPWLAALTLVLDSGKAFLAVMAPAVISGSPLVIASTSLSVMVGHAYSVWFLLREKRFSEGKSVACALGVLAAFGYLGILPWPHALLPPAVWVICLFGPKLVTGHWSCISIATLAATVSLPAAVCAAGPPATYSALSLLMAALVLVRHRNNIRRLLAGVEPRLGDRPALPERNP